MKVLLGIIGKDRVGKDTCADEMLSYLKSQNLTGAKIPLALALKKDVQTLTDFSLEEIELYKTLPDKVIGKKSMREFLITYGNKMRAEQGGDYWAKKVIQLALNQNLDWLIVPDIRYKDEFEYLKTFAEENKIFSIFIKIEKANIESVPYEVDKLAEDILIKNDKDIKTFKQVCLLSAQLVESLFKSRKVN
jgi:hypothetical protein